MEKVLLHTLVGMMAGVTITTSISGGDYGLTAVSVLVLSIYVWSAGYRSELAEGEGQP